MLPVQSQQSCALKNSALAPVDENSMVCAGSGQANQAGGCQGDSGGPFVCEEGGKWVLRGAVSWGSRMCQTNTYTVFARVSSYIDWFNQKMSGSYFTNLKLTGIHYCGYACACACGCGCGCKHILSLMQND